MSDTYMRTPHASLMLRQEGAKIGVWNLTADAWYRKPFTDSPTKASTFLRALRIRLNEKAHKVEQERNDFRTVAIVLSTLFFVGTFAGWW